MTPRGIENFGGTYEDYLLRQEQLAAQAPGRMQKAR
jgi:hypothetical protein